MGICKAAEVVPATIHDLRRSAITNWARRLAIHIVQDLAGHASIVTTRTYYLSVSEGDMNEARQVAAEAVEGLDLAVTGGKLTCD